MSVAVSILPLALMSASWSAIAGTFRPRTARPRKPDFNALEKVIVVLITGRVTSGISSRAATAQAAFDRVRNELLRHQLFAVVSTSVGGKMSCVWCLEFFTVRPLSGQHVA